MRNCNAREKLGSKTPGLLSGRFWADKQRVSRAPGQPFARKLCAPRKQTKRNYISQPPISTMNTDLFILGAVICFGIILAIGLYRALCKKNVESRQKRCAAIEAKGDEVLWEMGRHRPIIDTKNPIGGITKRNFARKLIVGALASFAGWAAARGANLQWTEKLLVSTGKGSTPPEEKSLAEPPVSHWNRPHDDGPHTDVPHSDIPAHQNQDHTDYTYGNEQHANVEHYDVDQHTNIEHNDQHSDIPHGDDPTGGP